MLFSFDLEYSNKAFLQFFSHIFLPECLIYISFRQDILDIIDINILPDNISIECLLILALFFASVDYTLCGYLVTNCYIFLILINEDCF